MKKHILVVLLCSWLVGCISADSYPESWAEPRMAQIGCSDLAGRYRDAGESADPALRRKMSLTRMLINSTSEVDAEIVEIVSANDTLRLRALRGGVLVAERDYTPEAGGLNCGADGVGIDPQFGLFGPAGNLAMVGIGGSSTKLRRGSDGSLIVRNSGQAAALVFLIPVVASETKLYRFAAAD